MLTKDLKQEALKRGFLHSGVNDSIEAYRTRNLTIYDFVCEESAVVRVCISKQHAGIYDVLSNIWKDCMLENYLEDPNQFANYMLSECAKKLLKIDRWRHSYSFYGKSQRSDCYNRQNFNACSR